MKTDNELRDIICLILTNSSLDRSTSLQNESVKEGLLTVFEQLFTILSKKCNDNDKEMMKEEHYIYPFDVLTNYTLNNSSISYTIMNWKNDFYLKLLKYCHSSNKEYSIICIELLISILEQSKAGAIASGISGTKECLNKIVKYDYLSDALRARAKQCIRDLKL